MNITVFEAFKNAIIRRRYQIGRLRRGTEVGSQFVPENYMDVITDDGTTANLNNTPNADTSTADLLMYVKPEQLPTIYSRRLVSGFMVKDTAEGVYYAITGANWAKNQESGELEHIELLLQETEVAVDE